MKQHALVPVLLCRTQTHVFDVKCQCYISRLSTRTKYYRNL